MILWLSLCQDGCQEKEQNLSWKEEEHESSIHWFIMKKSYIKNINENYLLIQYPISHLAFGICHLLNLVSVYYCNKQGNFISDVFII